MILIHKCKYGIESTKKNKKYPCFRPGTLNSQIKEFIQEQNKNKLINVNIELRQKNIENCPAI